MSAADGGGSEAFRHIVTARWHSAAAVEHLQDLEIAIGLGLSRSALVAPELRNFYLVEGILTSAGGGTSVRNTKIPEPLP